MIDLLTQ